MNKAEAIKQTAAEKVEALKPCPFCGARSRFDLVTRGYGIYVCCTDCPAQMFCIDEDDLLNIRAQENAATKLWNKRTEKPKRNESRIVRSRP